MNVGLNLGHDALEPALVDGFGCRVLGGTVWGCLAEGLARTPLVAMLDDDCWWEPEHLATLAELMDETAADFPRGTALAGFSDCFAVSAH